MPISSPLPPEVVAEIRRMRAAGEPIKVICADLGVCADSIVKYCADMVPWPKHEEKRRAAIAMAAEGKYVIDIAAELGIPLRTVLRALRSEKP